MGSEPKPRSVTPPRMAEPYAHNRPEVSRRTALDVDTGNRSSLMALKDKIRGAVAAITGRAK